MTHLPSSQLVAVARDFYADYMASCPPNRCRQPLGVVVNRNNGRCGLIFKEQSSLLMHEVFVPVSAIKAGGVVPAAEYVTDASPSHDLQDTPIEPTAMLY
ncbi:MAG: hypothetical protein AB4050_12055 [Synechococcus sp.]